jgi:serine/threonine protein kinase
MTSDGQVRLLDFGIAKLISESDILETALSQLGAGILTPDYASPEQISGQPIGVASDVYSLGVLLYELLVGERPYRLKCNSRWEDAILAIDPIHPFERVGQRFHRSFGGSSAVKKWAAKPFNM